MQAKVIRRIIAPEINCAPGFSLDRNLIEKTTSNQPYEVHRGEWLASDPMSTKLNVGIREKLLPVLCMMKSTLYILRDSGAVKSSPAMKVLSFS